MPTLDKFKSKKAILVIRARDRSVDITNENISKEVMMMEINRNILDNLYNISNVIPYLPSLFTLLSFIEC